MHEYVDVYVIVCERACVCVAYPLELAGEKLQALLLLPPAAIVKGRPCARVCVCQCKSVHTFLLHACVRIRTSSMAALTASFMA